MWYYYAAVLVASLVISRVLAPKPSAPPPGDISGGIPTAEAGKAIPVLFGTRIIAQPNVVWWGDILAEPIYSDGGKK